MGLDLPRGTPLLFKTTASPPPLTRKVLQSFYVEKEDTGSDPSRARDLVISALLYNLGFLRLAVLGQFDSAASVLQQAIELRKAVVGEAHSLTVQAVVSRGWALTLTGDTLLAVEELTRCEGRSGGTRRGTRRVFVEWSGVR